MPSENHALLERVQSSYKKLADVAADLNTASDLLGQIIGDLDAALKKLNLGITVWVAVRGSDDDESLDYWSEDLGYTKIDGKWGLALRTVHGNYNWPDRESIEAWLFSDAPRQLRLAAVGKIPDLFEKLSEQAVQTTQKIKAKLDETSALVTAIKKAAVEPTGRAKPAISKQAITGGEKQ